MIRLPIVAALLLAATPLAAQQTEAPPAEASAAQPAAEAPPPAKVWKTERVKLQTAEGPIVIELDTERAPITSANFLKYVDQKRFDGITFYRALTFPGRPDLGLIQGGQRDQKKLLPPIAHEPTSKTGLSNRDGAIAMARGAPGSAQSDFFIIMGDLSTLDASPKDPGFAVFGRVVEGMDTVKKILAAPVSATEGVGAMKGQMIAKPVPVTTARRVPK
ncbi:peptidylprolyl isomerase [Sandaracinobacter neustonicus]|uniref:peptidylprolyl isomerase n=1 Tax=Sandaracinobacter neustonicus TaxID=1715348 RepID=A0A501XGL9_9SPHN|nr:peptidylprolyl isomerase [Sandaracinobacter neustonicus]TPE59434.1 peptidylprolyl isomerase [Sandaracinobacter neustonicus]